MAQTMAMPLVYAEPLPYGRGDTRLQSLARAQATPAGLQWTGPQLPQQQQRQQEHTTLNRPRREDQQHMHRLNGAMQGIQPPPRQPHPRIRSRIEDYDPGIKEAQQRYEQKQNVTLAEHRRQSDASNEMVEHLRGLREVLEYAEHSAMAEADTSPPIWTSDEEGIPRRY